MSIEFLSEYVILLVLGVCLCMGYILKNLLPTLDNKYIPAIMGALGVIMVIWINHSLTPELLLQGLMSGLAATGLHQVFTQLINKEK